MAAILNYAWGGVIVLRDCSGLKSTNIDALHLLHDNTNKHSNTLTSSMCECKMSTSAASLS